MLIELLPIEVFAGRCRISARVVLQSGQKFSSGSVEEVLFFDWPLDYYRPEVNRLDPFAVALIPLAISLGESVSSAGLVSESLYLNMLEIIHVYNVVFEEKTKIIDLNFKVERGFQFSSSKVGSFFSGGVDSLFNIAEVLRLNAISNVSRVTDLWLVQGMDIPLEDELLWENTKNRLADVVGDMDGVELVDVRTNLRCLFDGIVPWSAIGFSAALGAICKCFSKIVPVALVGSYGTYQDVISSGFRHASSPLVDVLWSCDFQQVRHFSARFSRLQKIRVIHEVSPNFLDVLRVCYLNEGGAYNCGRCEKCLRTRLQLMVCGIPESAGLFEESLRYELLDDRTLTNSLKGWYAKSFWRELHVALLEREECHSWAVAVGALLERSVKVGKHKSMMSRIWKNFKARIF